MAIIGIDLLLLSGRFKCRMGFKRWREASEVSWDLNWASGTSGVGLVSGLEWGKGGLGE